MDKSVTIFWHRRDLRFHDNAGLYFALKENENVLPVFIFDTSILSKLEDKNDKRVEFIYQSVQNLKSGYEKYGSSIKICIGKPLDVFISLCNDYNIEAVYTNKDYEPYTKTRDNEINEILKSCQIPLYLFKDHVIFEEDEILKKDGKPYQVFTPYMKAWKQKLQSANHKTFDLTKYLHNLHKTGPLLNISIMEIGFQINNSNFPKKEIDSSLLKSYDQTRDIPAIQGTSRLSTHLRFGTISIRELVSKALIFNEIFLNELIWREFYMMILWHFPHGANKSFKPQFEFLEWRNNENDFEAWKNGMTGYPFVDAGMRELNNTGFMHNRARMITASFLTKHLLINWQWGEAYFASKLLDFELASNNGGWQWAASTGCDAVPYFRIFNPEVQQKRFDPELKYIRKWIPEYGSNKYPKPIVEHSFARKRALDFYTSIKNKK